MSRYCFIVTAAMIFVCVVAMSNPFADVPRTHWAYEAIERLAEVGVFEGYPDGTFKGDVPVTRYIMAVTTARMLANVERWIETGKGTGVLTKGDLHFLESLAVEFADELALLGVSVNALEDDLQIAKQDIAVLQRDVSGIKDYIARGGMERVRLSGDMLVRHANLIRRNDPNNDNVVTDYQLRMQFNANIDENITAVARFAMLSRSGLDASNVNTITRRGGALGSQGIGGLSVADSIVDTAYLHIEDMFNFGGDFTFGRRLYAHGHGMLVNHFIDTVRYYKRSGDVDIITQYIYDRHRGSYKDSDAIDFRNVFNINFETVYRNHNLYLGYYNQPEPNLAFRRFGIATLDVPVHGAALVAGDQRDDCRQDIEFGAAGPLGNSGFWSYDLGFVYTNYELSVVNTAGTDFISPEMKGWMGHAAVKWDSKAEWAAMVSYTFADDESVGGYALNTDVRYIDAFETPYEDIARGNSWFNNGLVNMNLLKLQAEYRPRNSKHYFRVAGDFLSENKNFVSNDLARYQQGDTSPGDRAVTAAAGLNDTAYDRWNNFRVSDPSATVLTFEYRYQLAENTRIRAGYTYFDFDGKFDRTADTKSGRGLGTQNDYDYGLFWTEIYSRF